MFAVQQKLPVRNRNKTIIDRHRKSWETAGNPVWTGRYFHDEHKETGQKPQMMSTHGMPVIQCEFRVGKHDLGVAGLLDALFVSDKKKRDKERAQVGKYLNWLGAETKSYLSKNEKNSVLNERKFPLSSTDVHAIGTKMWERFGDEWLSNNKILKDNTHFLQHLEGRPRNLFCGGDLNAAELLDIQLAPDQIENEAEMEQVNKYLEALVAETKSYLSSIEKDFVLKERMLLLRPEDIQEMRTRVWNTYRGKKLLDNRILSTNEYFLPHLGKIPRYLFFEEDAAHAVGEGRPQSGQLNLAELFAMVAYVQSYGTVEQGALGLSSVPVNLAGYRRSENAQADFVRKEADSADGQTTTRYYDPVQTPEDAQGWQRYGKWLRDYEKHAGGKGIGAVCVLDVSFASLPQINLWINTFGGRLKDIEKENPESMDSASYEDLIKMCNTYVVSYINIQEEKIKELKLVFDNARRLLQDRFNELQLENWRSEELMTVEVGEVENLFG